MKRSHCPNERSEVSKDEGSYRGASAPPLGLAETTPDEVRLASIDELRESRRAPADRKLTLCRRKNVCSPVMWPFLLPLSDAKRTGGPAQYGRQHGRE